MTLLRIIRHTSTEWCQETSIAGLGKTVKSDSSYFKKGYWFILFLIGSIWTCYNLHGVINEYLKYSVSTSNDLTFETSIQFPAVTICNQNRFDFKHFLQPRKTPAKSLVYSFKNIKVYNFEFDMHQFSLFLFLDSTVLIY